MFGLTFRVQDAVDILVMAFVIYRLMLMVKGTPAAPMAAGVAILGVVAGAASLLGLHSINWFFEHLRGVWLLAALIVFQPEVRKALGLIGKNRLVRAVLGRKETTIDVLVNTAFEFAARRIGALFVFERTVPLGNYVERGVRLNSEISRELLTAIFEAHSPLHDGAAIIEGDRVAAAAVMLPLTENPEVAKSRGARHRAALGITEVTDAVVVIVSEETGRVSITADGTLHAVAAVEDLKASLQDYLKGRL
ncbi:MAG TPA: diadenylate cyclase CdaA [bacterium]|nr:diadenylate cyclase CdaA [bacterium]